MKGLPVRVVEPVALSRRMEPTVSEVELPDVDVEPILEQVHLAVLRLLEGVEDVVILHKSLVRARLLCSFALLFLFWLLQLHRGPSKYLCELGCG